MLSASDILTYGSADLPTDDSGSTGGAIDTASGVLAESTPGVFIPSEPPPESPSGDVTWYYKLFKKNTNATYSMTDIKFFIVNGIDLAAASGVASIVSDDASETSGKVRLYGYYSSGTPGYEDINLNGVTTTPGSLNWDAGSPIRAQRLSGGSALTNAVGNITISKSGTPLGVILAGTKGATGEFELAIAAAKDDTVSMTNRLTNSAGLTFSRAYSEGSGLSMPSSADLDPGEAIGVWYKMIRYEDLPSPLDYTLPILRMKGRSS